MPDIHGAETGAAAASRDLMTEGEAKALATASKATGTASATPR
ncbi:hypothetical protein [Azospirillum himalayense]|uniref:Uncharacterized protein n=1 Tax=Azospirillum himalayense TaxID=654847 RepID=A0ABW0G1A1_9PROT